MKESIIGLFDIGIHRVKIKWRFRVRGLNEKSARIDSGKFKNTTIYNKIKRVPKFKVKPLMKGMKYILRKPEK